MVFSDLVQKVLGLDQTKEYDIIEQNSVVEHTKDAVIEQECSTDEQKNNTPEIQELMAQIAAKNNSIAELKAMNLALLTKTPVESKEDLTIEDRIYQAVYGNK